jgi:hypothetical protein
MSIANDYERYPTAKWNSLLNSMISQEEEMIDSFSKLPQSTLLFCEIVEKRIHKINEFFCLCEKKIQTPEFLSSRDEIHRKIERLYCKIKRLKEPKTQSAKKVLANLKTIQELEKPAVFPPFYFKHIEVIEQPTSKSLWRKICSFFICKNIYRA